jgi:hypothetical protein
VAKIPFFIETDNNLPLKGDTFTPFSGIFLVKAVFLAPKKVVYYAFTTIIFFG